ncbi:hypothetical protein BC834DRAFT_514602 [Gloeopeniophorella convolvens]|nr:hypothetical protein BC834DRAFT_514602 [Gloeopeniophorella convolvens]
MCGDCRACGHRSFLGRTFFGAAPPRPSPSSARAYCGTDCDTTARGGPTIVYFLAMDSMTTACPMNSVLQFKMPIVYIRTFCQPYAKAWTRISVRRTFLDLDIRPGTGVYVGFVSSTDVPVVVFQDLHGGCLELRLSWRSLSYLYLVDKRSAYTHCKDVCVRC